MKNPHRKLAVYISGFLIGSVFAAAWRNWKESTRLQRAAFMAALIGLAGLVVWLILRAFR